MLSTTRSTFLASAALLAALAAPAAAQETASFEGEIDLGLRSVDVGGAETKFREDVDLDDGPRLFGLHLKLVPDEALRAHADQVQLDLRNFGGDPFETLTFRMRKIGRYDFRFDRRESEYFYEDTILPPELASVRLSSGGDFHHFDFERVQETARLALDLSRRAKLSLGFDRMTKRGESTTTLDISRDEFELDKPIDESLDVYSASFEYAWDPVTLVITESYREYENRVDLFLPGFSLGENPTGAQLDFFFLEQPYDLSTLEHAVRVVARPHPRWTLVAGAILQSSEIDVTARESSQGIAFNGIPFTTSAEGGGDLERDVGLFDLELTFRASPRYAVVVRGWSKSLEQEGVFTFDDDRNEGLWDLETRGAEAGLEVHLSPKLVLAGGLRQESRDTEWGAEEGATGGPLELESQTTDDSGFFASLAWRPTKALRWTTRYEDDSIDDPFTLASATGRQRLRTRLRYRWNDAWTLNGSFEHAELENDNSGWLAETDQLHLRLAYAKGPRRFSLGYGALRIDRAIDQVVVTLPGFGGGQELPFPIAYEVDTQFLDAAASCRLAERWRLGGEARLYENDGSFGIERTDLRGWVEVAVGRGYVLRTAYRTLDYDETAFDFDDYDADILELGFGYRWGSATP